MPSEPSRQPSERKFTIPVTIVFIALAIWSIVQGIIAITFGSLFYSFSLSTFGISSIGQLVVLLYIYRKLLTEHYMKSSLTTPTETTPLNNRVNVHDRRRTEKKIAICGMFIFILLAVVTFLSIFYINEKFDDYPEHDRPPNGGDDDDGDERKRRPTFYILLFSIYAIHPFFILIPTSWYLSSTTHSLVWRDATVWSILFFLMAYVQFINSQLLYFVKWKTREVTCTLLMAVLFLVYAVRLGWTYLRKGGNIEDIVRPAASI